MAETWGPRTNGWDMGTGSRERGPRTNGWDMGTGGRERGQRAEGRETVEPIRHKA